MMFFKGNRTEIFVELSIFDICMVLCTIKQRISCLIYTFFTSIVCIISKKYVDVSSNEQKLEPEKHFLYFRKKKCRNNQ